MATESSVTTNRDARDEMMLDRSVIAEFRTGNAGGVPDFAVVLIDQFIEEAEGQVAAIGQAAERHDVRALKALGHSLRGSSSMLGARRLAAWCGQLEAAAEQDAAAMIDAVASEIDGEFVKVRCALNAERQGIGIE